MAMLALSKPECDEILEYLRASLPDVEDTLLQELAGNFGLDALADIDPVEIENLLAVPGPRIVLRSTIQGGNLESMCLKDLFPELSASKIDLATVASALLVIKTATKHSLTVTVFNRLIDLSNKELHPASAIGSPIYKDKKLRDETSLLLLVLSGVGTQREVLDARWGEALARQKIEVESEIPHFLQRQGDATL